jgi:high-affinity iron transporter
MLLSSVILILREVLEAAILISLLIALSLNLRLGVSWLLYAVLPVSVGIISFSGFIEPLTQALDGVGQEVSNATLQLLVYCLVLGIAVTSGKTTPSEHQAAVVRGLMAAAVSCALIREGSEILIYITGFSGEVNLRNSIFIGSAIGVGIGIGVGVSMGVLIFASLRALQPARIYQVSLLLLSFIAAGMLMQATMLLQQADWLPSGQPLWDTSQQLSKQSVAGELLYAVFGYESTPSIIQVTAYGLGLMGMGIAWATLRVGR